MKTVAQMLASKPQQNVHTVAPEASMLEALRVMAEHNIGALPVTDAGRLVGHINLCLGKLDRHLAKSGLDEELILHFQHLILSHHGLYEYGSPRLPQTAEAFALHYADNIDAKITQSRSLFGELEDGESGWSPYQKSLERQLFLAPKTPETESRKPHTSKRTAAEPEAPRLNQCSLL